MNDSNVDLSSKHVFYDKNKNKTASALFTFKVSFIVCVYACCCLFSLNFC